MDTEQNLGSPIPAALLQVPTVPGCTALPWVNLPLVRVWLKAKGSAFVRLTRTNEEARKRLRLGIIQVGQSLFHDRRADRMDYVRRAVNAHHIS